MLVHIVGNRPQFIKLAAVSRELSKRGYQQVIIHTGQHYDQNMSDIFFEQLGIQKPDVNLAIGSGTHGQMTGKAIIEIEKVLQEYRPECVLLYGDTDSTLAGAVATVKMNIPIVHVEAGVRTGSLRNPEEANRLATDHFSEILFCSDKDSMMNLKHEGLEEKAVQVGDVMYDTFLYHNKNQTGKIIGECSLTKTKYVLMTWHRQENTESPEKMMKILDFLRKVECKIVCPLHPRTRAKLEEHNLLEQLEKISNVMILPPVGYIDMISLMSNAQLILTDSGGVSKESFFAGVPCVLMVDLKLWPDLMEHHWITRLDFDDEKSVQAALNRIYNSEILMRESLPAFYGNGDAAEKIVDVLEERYNL